MTLEKNVAVDYKVKQRISCRLCGASQFELALPMKPSPIGDAYVRNNRLHEVQDLYPLDLYQCKECHHIQLRDVVNPSLLFRDYIFRTVSSPGLVNHFKTYASEVLDYVGCAKNSLVVEIGSNDGTLLQFFKNHGMRVLGIDPATSIAQEATKSGVETYADFFTSNLAETIKDSHGEATLVCANNVFAHIDDIQDVVKGIKQLLAVEGVFVFEASYLVDTLQKKLLDTIYHEHVCYHSVEPLVQLFKKNGLEFFHVERIATKGGSIRGYVKRSDSKRTVSASVKKLIELEMSLGLANLSAFHQYADELSRTKAELLKLLKKLKSNGASIAGFGASVTVTTLLYYFELGPLLDYLIDDNPEKDGLYSPGYHLPVVNSNVLYERPPDYVVILAWQYADAIRKKHEQFTINGGHFVVPLPQVQVYP